jgi:hypothetical protein
MPFLPDPGAQEIKQACHGFARLREFASACVRKRGGRISWLCSAIVLKSNSLRVPGQAADDGHGLKKRRFPHKPGS